MHLECALLCSTVIVTALGWPAFSSNLIESLTILSLAGGPEDVVERVIYVPM